MPEIWESLSYQLLKVLSQKRLREFKKYSNSLLVGAVYFTELAG